MGLVPDHKWLGFMQQMSLGPFSRTLAPSERDQNVYGKATNPAEQNLAVFDRHADFLPKYATRRSLLEENLETKKSTRGRHGIRFESPQTLATRRLRMSDTELFHSRLPTPDEAEAVEYRAISALAVVGLLCGLAAATAILSPALWIVPLTGVLLNVLALGRIARETPALIGRKAALAGLLLSVFFGAVAMADWYTYSEMIRREARQFATLWFDSLRDHEPQKAHQLTRSPKTRRPFDDKLWEIYFDGSEPREDLKAYLERPEVGPYWPSATKPRSATTPLPHNRRKAAATASRWSMQSPTLRQGKRKPSSSTWSWNANTSSNTTTSTRPRTPSGGLSAAKAASARTGRRGIDNG